MSSRCSNPGSASGSGRRRSVPSVRRALSQDGYDAGVKKPVAVPNSRKTPSGVVWETSRLHVTRSPCTLGLNLDEVSVSVWVVLPVGVNWKVRPKPWGMNTAVLPTTWAGVNSPFPLTTT